MNETISTEGTISFKGGSWQKYHWSCSSAFKRDFDNSITSFRLMLVRVN